MRCVLFSLLVGLAVGTSAAAGLVPQANLYSKLDADGINYDYDIVLTNTLATTATAGVTSSTTIGTFWFAWIPGQDYLQFKPISTTSPAGWVALLTHVPNVATNGWAIQWKATSSASYIAVGSSLTFSFVSAETPASIAGPTPYFNHPLETVSFVYNQAPFSAVAQQFTVDIASPEPTTVLPAVLGALGLGVRNYRNRKSAIIA